MSTRRQIAALAFGDAFALTTSAAVAWGLKALENPALDPWQYLATLPAMIGGCLLIYAGLGLYPAVGCGSAAELRRLSWGTTLAILAGFAVTFLARNSEAWSRQVFLTAWVGALFLVPLQRAVMRRACCHCSWWGIPCVVLGAGATGVQVVGLLTARPWLGLRPVALLDDDLAKQGTKIAELVVAGPLAEVSRLPAQGISHAILAMPGLPAERLSRMLDQLGDHLRHVFIAPALPGSPDVIAETREFANTLVLEVRQNLLRPDVRVVKRTIDIIAVSAGLLLFWWVFAALALAVKLSSPGPLFYGQQRIGRGGHVFKAWKFRSMVKDADAQLASYLAAHPELREQWERDHKLRDDPRVTWIGRLLRRTSLDELPQLWNILCGEMSLVGPRPIVQDEVAKYGERFALFCKVRPGLSGLWQVSGRSDTTYAERVALDCYYVRNWSVWLDLVILARTVRVVLLGKGAY